MRTISTVGKMVVISAFALALLAVATVALGTDHVAFAGRHHSSGTSNDQDCNGCQGSNNNVQNGNGAFGNNG